MADKIIETETEYYVTSADLYLYAHVPRAWSIPNIGICRDKVN